MSTIEKLLIRGIRSFGTQEGDQQEIVFQTPLTVIVGVNGSGKTTIIECLKYALTGELPPGTDKGTGFVHDPKIDKFPECLAQVKLKVRDIMSREHIITRSMKTTHKTTKNTSRTTFETLDASIESLGAGPSRGQMSKRTADINAEMSDIMGVSKAILNNVIFCHQENSSWPLDEQKRVKEKFDAIFGTTEYNRVIEKLIKIRKGYNEKIIKKTGDLRLLESHKQDADAKNVDMERLRMREIRLKESLEQFERDRQPLEDRIANILKIEMEYSKLHSQLVELQTELKNKKERQESLAKNIQEVFDGSMELLEVEIRNFDSRMRTKKEELTKLEMKNTNLCSEKEALDKQITQIQINSRLLVEKIQQEQNLYGERARNARKLCGMLKISVTSDLENSVEAVDELIPKMDDGVHAKGVAVEDLHQRQEKAEEAAQKAIDEVKNNIIKLESEIGSKTKQMREKKAEEEKIQVEIDDVERSQATLKDLGSEIERTTKTLEDLKNKMNENEVKKEIDDLRDDLKAKQKRFDEVDEEMQFLSSMASTTAAISAKERQLEERETEAKRIRNKHADSLKDFFPEGISSNYRRSFIDVQEKLQREIQSTNSDKMKQEKRLAQLEATRKNQMDEVKRMKADLASSEEEIYELCRSTPYQDVVDRLREQIAKCQLEHGSLKSSESFYRAYIKKMSETPCCPLCHKDLQADEVENLSTELTSEIHDIPKNAEKAEAQLRQLRKKYDALMALKPVTEKVDCLKREIPGKEETLKATEREFSDVTSSLEDLELAGHEPESKLKIVNGLIGDMSVLDDVVRLVNRFQAELVAIKEKLPTRSAKCTMEEAKIEKQTLSTELKTSRNDLERKEQALNKHKEKVNELREKRNRLEARQIDLQKGVQALSQLRARVDELHQQIEALNLEITEAKRSLLPFNRELEVKIDDKTKLRAKNREILAKERANMDTMKRLQEDINEQSRTLREIKRENLQAQVDNLQRGKVEGEKALAKIRHELDALGTQIDEVKRNIVAQDMEKRQLLDNKELKQLKRDEEELEIRYDDLNRNIGDLNIRNMMKEKKELIARQDRINQERSKLSGQKSELDGQIERLEKELNETRYKDAAKNHRTAVYELSILKKTTDDLNQYRVALEWALLKYHSEKMIRINKLIKDLWMEIYRGNDIDYIQIKTDESPLTSGSEKRRTYNYRVVQVKNSVELEMRGRCSAGQRVLACLIIRIALAETFSSNCNVLALDEPTTNLDQKNIESLGEALSRLVDKREIQSNFMLVVITHDENFLVHLTSFEYYYRVRQEKGKSVIVKHRRGDI